MYMYMGTVCITQWYTAPRIDRLSTDYRLSTIDDDDDARDLVVSTRSSLLAELSREPLVNLEIGGGDGGSRAEEHWLKSLAAIGRREDARRVSEPGELFEDEGHAPGSPGEHGT